MAAHTPDTLTQEIHGLEGLVGHQSVGDHTSQTRQATSLYSGVRNLPQS